MDTFTRRLWIFAMAASVVAFSSFPVAAQQTKVGGVIINLGITPADVALRADGHRDAHPQHPPAGSQHVLITLDDEKSGQRMGDAEVAVEVKDPHGKAIKKSLLHTQAGGLPDYSELFQFSWSGEYTLHVTVTRPGVAATDAKPIETTFTVHHSV